MLWGIETLLLVNTHGMRMRNNLVKKRNRFFGIKGNPFLWLAQRLPDPVDYTYLPYS